MSTPYPHPVWIQVDADDIAHAHRLAEARMADPSRRLSPDRPTARNMNAQIRGALGELAAVKWLRANGMQPGAGFEADSMHSSDLQVGDVRLEIMTAQIAHREITGFCVPPNKLAAARKRSAWGYLFVGTGREVPCEQLLIQAAVALAYVDADSPRHTAVSPSSPSVLNHVMRAEHLLQPEALLRVLRTHVGRQS